MIIFSFFFVLFSFCVFFFCYFVFHHLFSKQCIHSLKYSQRDYGERLFDTIIILFFFYYYILSFFRFEFIVRGFFILIKYSSASKSFSKYEKWISFFLALVEWEHKTKAIHNNKKCFFFFFEIKNEEWIRPQQAGIVVLNGMLIVSYTSWILSNAHTHCLMW